MRKYLKYITTSGFTDAAFKYGDIEAEMRNAPIVDNACILVQQATMLRYLQFMVVDCDTPSLLQWYAADLKANVQQLSVRLDRISSSEVTIRTIVEKALRICQYMLGGDPVRTFKTVPPFTPIEVAHYFQVDSFSSDLCFPCVMLPDFAQMFVAHIHNITSSVPPTKYLNCPGVLLLPMVDFDNACIYMRACAHGEYNYDVTGFAQMSKSQLPPNIQLILSSPGALPNTASIGQTSTIEGVAPFSIMAQFAQCSSIFNIETPDIRIGAPVCALYSLIQRTLYKNTFQGLNIPLRYARQNPIAPKFEMCSVNYAHTPLEKLTLSLMEYLVSVKGLKFNNNDFITTFLQEALGSSSTVSITDLVAGIRNEGLLTTEQYNLVQQHPLMRLGKPTLLKFFMEDEGEEEPAEDPADDDMGGDDMGGDDMGGDDFGGDDMGGDDFGGDDGGGFGDSGGFGDDEDKEEEPVEEHLFNLGPEPKLDSILYRLELERKITLVLENPPKNADPGVLKVLAKLKNYWLHLVDFKTLQILIKTYSKGALT